MFAIYSLICFARFLMFFAFAWYNYGFSITFTRCGFKILPKGKVQVQRPKVANVGSHASQVTVVKG